MSINTAGFPYELCLIPLALLVTVAGLYFLAIRWLQRSAEQDLEQLRGEARRFDTARKTVENTLQAYQDVPQEPFYSRIEALRAQLDEVDRQNAGLRSRRVALKQHANNLSGNYWRAMMGAPFGWYFLRRDLRRLRQDMEQARLVLNATGEKEQAIRRIGWDIAQQARIAQKDERLVRQLLDGLRNRGIHGATFDANLRHVNELDLQLKKIPSYLYHSSEEEILSRVNPDTVVSAYSIIEQVQPDLENVLTTGQAWEQSYERASTAATDLQRQIEEIARTLNTLPAGIDAGETVSQLKALRQIASSLQNTLSHAEVETLAGLEAEANRQLKFGQAMSQDLRRARREVVALQSTLNELPAGFKDLSLQLAMLGAKSVHPIAWRVSVDKLTELNRRAANLKPADQPRTPQQVIVDLQTAAELRAGQKELVGHCQAVQNAHTALLELLASPDFVRLESWLEETGRLAEKSASYAPDNWSRAEAMNSLANDITMLKSERSRLQIDRPQEAINESQVSDRLQDVRGFFETYTGMQHRAAEVRLRLEEMIQAEKRAGEQLEVAANALGKIEYVVDSNEFLGGIAVQEIDRFGGEINRLRADLNERQRGRIDKKIRQVDSLIARVETGANRWLDRLVGEINQQAEELSGLLKGLDEIASLEEKPVVEARRLLSTGAGQSAEKYAGRASYTLDALLPEIKRHSDYWQACSAAINALQDFHPLIETYQEMLYQRDQARKALNEAAAAVRQKRAWPPTTVTFDAEWQELARIDAQLQELRQGSAKAIARTAQLGSLAAKYQSLADRVIQAAERAAHERTEVDEIEAQINELAELWRNNLYQFDSLPEVSGEIKALLEDIHHTLAQIRRQYLQGGADYAGTLQTMKALNKRVRYYQVALDEESALDVQGNVHRRRESRRI